VGVETTDGKKIVAKRFVASSVDPTQTFLRLVGEKNLDSGLVAKVKDYKYGVSGKSFGVLFALHAGVRERPAYASAAWDPLINDSFNCCIGYETPEEVIEHLEEVIDGTPPEVIGMQAACPSIFDATRAPAGKHVLLGWQFAPFALKDGGAEGWERLRGPYAEKMLARWRQYAPNLEPKNIIYSFGQTPVDTQEHLINMRRPDPRPARLQPAVPGGVELPHADQAPVPDRGWNPPRRQHNGRAGLQRGPGHRPRSGARPVVEPSRPAHNMGPARLSRARPQYALPTR
ncbi:MAG: hypothetical protein HYU75_02470, partial [Betaproteobacteria bacterium]|nr:hypothetical protein [Betaproteobacteria bacterium]